jgi:transposase
MGQVPQSVLTERRSKRLRCFLPQSHGWPRQDDKRVLGGIVFINRQGLQWSDAPKELGPANSRTNHLVLALMLNKPVA